MEVEKSSLTRSSTSNRAKVTHDQLHGVTHKMSPHAINRSDNTKYEQNPMNKVDSPTTHFNTRLFNARKQFSKPSVPIISFDDQISPTTSPQSSRSTYSRNVMYKTDSMESKTSVPVSPTELSYTSNFEKNLSYITTTMRALSTSPRKGSPNALIPPYNKTLLPLAFSFDAINPEYPGDKANILPQTNKGVSDKISHETHNANRSNKKGSLSPKPYLLKSSHVTGKIYMPNTLSAVTPMALAASGDDVMLSLVHQRSTESHDSSISMPSATSSGGSPYTSSASHLLKSIRKEDKLYRSTDVNFNMDEQRMPNPEQHIIRRSSYEMATGKLELPIKNQRKRPGKKLYVP
ncbi:unnamed protein product [Heterobilharzia americana]|nr:unnamed protein product [Heterobilharzia americana]